MTKPDSTTAIWIVSKPVGQDGLADTEHTAFDLAEAPAPTDEELARWSKLSEFVQSALRASSARDLAQIPERIGPFEVIQVLGRGGNGTVYLARDPALPRVVAVKVPHGDLLRVKGTRERFLKEAGLVAGLQHPHILEIHQIGEANGWPYLVFEYCPGGSLAEWFAKQTAPLNPRTCAEIVKMLAHAVQHAHAQGILHRDLNPRNVLLVPDQTAGDSGDAREFPFVTKLSDFGLGVWLDANQADAHTQTGTVVGTIPYMAPEQTSGSSRFLQPAVDVHALGVMLYELLTRQRPYVGKTTAETLRLIQESAPPSLRKTRKGPSRDLETICLKCLEKQPGHRYLTAQLLADDLDRYLTHRQILARRTPIATRLVRWLTLHPLVAILLAVICLLSGLMGVGTYWYSSQLATSLEQVGVFQSQSKGHQELIQDMAYAGQIRRAQELLEAGYDHTAGQLLREWIPRPDEPDRRNFGWYYVTQASGSEMISLPRQMTDECSLYSATASPDGRSLYIGLTGVIEKWDLTTHSLAQRIKLAQDPEIVRDLLLDRDGNLLFTRMQHSGIFRWSTQRTKEQAPYVPSGATSEFCNRIVLSKDQKFVVSLVNQTPFYDPPTRVRLHSYPAGKLIWDKTWRDQRSRDTTFDPTTRNVVTLLGHQLLVMNLEGQTVQDLTLQCNGAQPQSLAVSPNGEWLAVSLDDRGILLCRKDASHQWMAAGELPIKRERRQMETDEARAHFRNPLTFCADSNRLFSACDTELHLWDVTRGIELQAILKLPGPVRSLKLLADDQTVAWGSAFQMGLWRPRPRHPQVAGHTKETWSVAFSPDGKLMATGSDDETIKLWDVRTGRELHTLRGHIATVSTVAFSPDGRWLASASLDQTIRIWNVDQPTQFREITGHMGTVRCLAWSPDGQSIVSGDHNRTGPISVIVWDVVSGRPRQTWQDHRNRATEALFLKDGIRCVSVSEDMTIKVRDVRTGKLDLEIPDTDQLHSAVLLNDDRWLATGNKAGIIRIWNLTSGVLVKELRGHAVSVKALAVSPDGRILASGSDDMSVRVWDAHSGESLLVLKGHQAPVNSVAFSPNGEILASGAHDGSVQLWHAPRIDSTGSRD